MRPLNEWTEADLKSLIDNQVQESLYLDYKASPSLAINDKSKSDISKDVAAFANSAGGRIIYGVVERGHVPVSIDTGSNLAIITKEWLEQVILSNVKPKVSGIFIKQIELHSGGVAYVIDVKQSMALAPHQSSDNRYYNRYNFHSIPMEDYEIRDIMRRATTGRPVVKIVTQKQHENQDGVIFNFEFKVTNNSNEPVMCATITIIIDKELVDLKDKKLLENLLCLTILFEKICHLWMPGF